MIALLVAATLAAPPTADTFAIEMPAKMPELVIVEAPHRGTRVATVPPRNGDVELAPVELPPPSFLDVVARRPAGRHDAVEALPGASAPSEAPLWFARRHLAGRAGSTHFASLAAGTYTLLVRGSGPLQQAATTTVLRAVDGNRSTIVIAPRTVETQVMLGGERVANATVKRIKGDYVCLSPAPRSAPVHDAANVARSRASRQMRSSPS